MNNEQTLIPAQRVGRGRRVLAVAAIVTALGGGAAACGNPDCANQVPRSSHCSGTWF